MFKVVNDLSPDLMQEIFQKREQPYNLRNSQPFKLNNVRTVRYGTETLSTLGPKIWAIIPNEIKLSVHLSEFRSKIKFWKPKNCPCRLCKTYVTGFIYIKFSLGWGCGYKRSSSI